MYDDIPTQFWFWVRKTSWHHLLVAIYATGVFVCIWKTPASTRNLTLAVIVYATVALTSPTASFTEFSLCIQF